MTATADVIRQQRLLRQGRLLESATLTWNMVGIVVLAIGHHPHHSPTGIGWTALTAAVMFALAYGKHRTGQALPNPVLIAESRVTVIDGLLALAVLTGLILNAAAGWWWADPAAALVIVYYALREARTIRAHLAGS